MRRTAVALTVALGLGGCAHVSAVNPDSGIVEGTTSASLALKQAEAFCAKTGRTAHAANFDALLGKMMFDCVARSG